MTLPPSMSNNIFILETNAIPKVTATFVRLQKVGSSALNGRIIDIRVTLGNPEASLTTNHFS